MALCDDIGGAAAVHAVLDAFLKVAREKLEYDKTHPMPPATIPGTNLPSPYGRQ